MFAGWYVYVRWAAPHSKKGEVWLQGPQRFERGEFSVMDGVHGGAVDSVLHIGCGCCCVFPVGGWKLRVLEHSNRRGEDGAPGPLGHRVLCLHLGGGELLPNAVGAAHVSELAEELAAAVALHRAYVDAKWCRVFVDEFSQCTGGVRLSFEEVDGDVSRVVVHETDCISVASERWALSLAPEVGVDELERLAGPAARGTQMRVHRVAGGAGVAEGGVPV